MISGSLIQNEQGIIKFNHCTNGSPHCPIIDILPPEMLKPFSKAPRKEITRRDRQLGKTRIMTMTPEKGIENDNSKYPKNKMKNIQLTVMKSDSTGEQVSLILGRKFLKIMTLDQKKEMIMIILLGIYKKKLKERK